MARTMAFLLSRFPHIVNYPQSPPGTVHLMNCYFPDFWYSHVTEKRTLRREMLIAPRNLAGDLLDSVKKHTDFYPTLLTCKKLHGILFWIKKKLFKGKPAEKQGRKARRG